MAQKDQKIHLITGKGGVGKSTVAAAFALNLSQRGHKVLLVELGDRGFFSYVWNQDFKFEPIMVSENLFISRWSGEDSLREYFTHLLKVKPIVDLIFDNKIMKALVRAAPALNELSILGKLTSGLRGIGPRFDFDHVVVDAYATGHFRALLNAPRGMGKAIPKGPMGDQSRAIDEVIGNRDLTKIKIVSLPEELPVNESLELQEFLKQEFGIQATFILNKCIEPPLSIDELDALIDSERANNLSLPKFLRRSLSEQKKFRNILSADEQAAMALPHMLMPTSLKLIEELATKLNETVS